MLDVWTFPLRNFTQGLGRMSLHTQAWPQLTINGEIAEKADVAGFFPEETQKVQQKSGPKGRNIGSSKQVTIEIGPQGTHHSTCAWILPMGVHLILEVPKLMFFAQQWAAIWKDPLQFNATKMDKKSNIRHQYQKSFQRTLITRPWNRVSPLC